MTVFLSGIQSSGRLHFGNWFGAIRQHIALQEEPGEHFYFIADYHALTSVRSPNELSRLTYEVVEAESGPIGGSASHEFMVPAKNGEDRIVRCGSCGVVFNALQTLVDDWARTDSTLPGMPALPPRGPETTASGSAGRRAG